MRALARGARGLAGGVGAVGQPRARHDDAGDSHVDVLMVIRICVCIEVRARHDDAGDSPSFNRYPRDGSH